MVQELLEEKKQRKKQLQALEDLRQKEEKLKQELDQKQVGWNGNGQTADMCLGTDWEQNFAEL